MAVGQFETIMLRNYGEDASHLRRTLVAMDAVGLQITPDRIDLFCMMYFTVPIEEVTRKMRRFANLTFRTWDSVGSVNPTWAANYLLTELDRRIDARDGQRDFSVHRLADIRLKLASTDLFETIRERYNALLEQGGRPPIPEVERVNWERKIRIKRG